MFFRCLKAGIVCDVFPLVGVNLVVYERGSRRFFPKSEFSPMLFLAEMPAVISPEHDHRVRRVGGPIKRIEKPIEMTNPVVQVIDRDEQNIHRLRRFFVCGVYRTINTVCPALLAFQCVNRFRYSKQRIRV